MAHAHAKGLFRGRKISKKHSTVIKQAEIVVKTAKNCSEVSKIVLGVITRIKNGRPRIKFTVIDAGFRVNVRGVNTNQLLFIYTKDLETTKRTITQKWEETYR